ANSFLVLVNAAPSGEEAECPAVCTNTLEYEPVCGSDNTTYGNSGDLKCAQKCKPDLRKVHAGPCQERVTMVDSESAGSTQSEKQGDCGILCPITADISPVCGSDGITYENPSALKCAQKCKPELQQAHGGPCQRNVTTKDSTSAGITLSEQLEVCGILCIITHELRPVCGSDGITYNNPSILRCAQKCKPGNEFYHNHCQTRLIFTGVPLTQSSFR
ncbi:hypothetical protein QAD02_010294, partial [Eretmocerus hayati]